LRSFVFVERISEVTDVFERERNFEAVSRAIATNAGVADVSGYTDYGRVWLEFLEQVVDDLDPRSTVIVLGDARTHGRAAHAHAWVSGQLARNWVLDRVEPWEEVCLAAEQHDIGMAAWDAAPELNPGTGRPYSFIEMPLETHLRLWTAAPERMLPQSRYAAVL